MIASSRVMASQGQIGRCKSYLTPSLVAFVVSILLLTFLTHDADRSSMHIQRFLSRKKVMIMPASDNIGSGVASRVHAQRLLSRKKSGKKMQTTENTTIPDADNSTMPTANLTAVLANSSAVLERAELHIANSISSVFESVVKPPAPAPARKRRPVNDMHFIHIPKCGGTSMTAVLRDIVCQTDSGNNEDCCTNPGYCDWHAGRRCESIKGCTDHNPHRPFIYKEMPSVTMLREPISRIMSAWLYRGHSPNMDFFNVRPEFELISQGKAPKVKFDEYVEMPEYQNIQTRMIGADSFPYRNVTVDDKVYDDAVDALNHLFFVGIQDEYSISIQVMLRQFNVTASAPLKNERNNHRMKSVKNERSKLKKDSKLTARMKEVNNYDIRLYHQGLVKFCGEARKYPDLFDQMAPRTQTQCYDIFLKALVAQGALVDGVDGVGGGGEQSKPSKHSKNLKG